MDQHSIDWRVEDDEDMSETRVVRYIDDHRTTMLLGRWPWAKYGRQGAYQRAVQVRLQGKNLMFSLMKD